MTLDAERLAELRRLAEQATPGPWRSCIEGRDHKGGDSVIFTAGGEDIYVRVHATDARWQSDQDFIAAADPSTVLALLDRLEAAEATVRDFLCGEYDVVKYERDALRDEVERLRELLRECVEWLEGEDAMCGAEDGPHTDGCPWPRVVEEARAEEGET